MLVSLLQAMCYNIVVMGCMHKQNLHLAAALAPCAAEDAAAAADAALGPPASQGETPLSTIDPIGKTDLESCDSCWHKPGKNS